MESATTNEILFEIVWGSSILIFGDCLIQTIMLKLVCIKMAFQLYQRAKRFALPTSPDDVLLCCQDLHGTKRYCVLTPCMAVKILCNNPTVFCSRVQAKTSQKMERTMLLFRLLSKNKVFDTDPSMFFCCCFKGHTF